jgi:hypothetical protein
LPTGFTRLASRQFQLNVGNIGEIQRLVCGLHQCRGEVAVDTGQLQAVAHRGTIAAGAQRPLGKRPVLAKKNCVDDRLVIEKPHTKRPQVSPPVVARQILGMCISKTAPKLHIHPYELDLLIYR